MNCAFGFRIGDRVRTKFESPHQIEEAAPIPAGLIGCVVAFGVTHANVPAVMVEIDCGYWQKIQPHALGLVVDAPLPPPWWDLVR